MAPMWPSTPTPFTNGRRPPVRCSSPSCSGSCLATWVSHGAGSETGAGRWRGFSREQLRTFSKRTLQIEAELERRGEVYESAADRMRTDDQAALATRRPKDRHLTPALLQQAWEAEARTVGLDSPEQVERLVVARDSVPAELSQDDVFAALVDPDIGLCAKEARFGEAHVYERVSALSQGRWDQDEVRRLSEAFLASPTRCDWLRPTTRGARRGRGRQPSIERWRTTCCTGWGSSPADATKGGVRRGRGRLGPRAIAGR